VEELLATKDENQLEVTTAFGKIDHNHPVGNASEAIENLLHKL
jgi:hypothetical protein